MSGHEHPSRLQPSELIKRHSEETLRAILRSTPFVPYGADAEAIQNDVADAKSELERLQDYIADATSELERLQGEITLAIARVKQLKGECQPIQSYIKLREAIFAPIRQLPTEILLEIFLIASPSVSITATAGFPWKLGCVCGRWRDIVLSSPKLWSCIDLGFPGEQVSNRRGLQACNLLGLCLARSGEHPLSIRLWAHKSNVEVSRDIVKIALQVQNRWKNLRYISGNWDINNSDALLPPTLNLPMLQRLEFDPPRRFRLSIVSPSLESLELTSSSNLSVRTLTQAWPRIKHLTLRLYSHIDPDDFASTLLQLPELLELNILGLHRSNSPSTIPVHLDRLLILKTALENPIIGNVTTPNLQTLLVRGESSTPTSSESLSGGQIIANLVKRSHCSIVRLILPSRRLSTRAFLQIVGVTPNVEHLDLLFIRGKTLWEHLMYKGDLTLLPRLRALNLGMVSSSECRDLVHVVKSRAATPSSSGGHGSSPGRLRNLSLRLPHVQKNKDRLEIQYLDQLQGFGGLKVDFESEPWLAI